MKYIFIVILLSIICSTVFPQSQKELLYKAYQDSFYELLEQFFENWRLEKTPITDEEYENLSDVQKDVYDLFYEFYNPFNLKDRESVYNVVINPRMDYKIIESLDRDSIFLIILRDVYKYDLDTVDLSKFNEKKKDFFISAQESSIPPIERDSILNFRPRVKFTNARVLYYSLYYDSLLSDFVGSDSISLDSHDSEQVSYADNVGNQKTYFLYPYIYVRTNLSGDDLYLLTKPIVYLIVFDRHRTKAKMFYSTYDESRYSLFKRINGKLKIIKDVHYIWWD